MKKILILIVCVLFLQQSYSQKKAFTIEDLYKVKNVGNPVLSPSGNKLALTVADYNLKEGSSNTDIYLMNVDGTDLKNISDKKKNESSPIWINDNELYFLDDGKLNFYSISDNQTKKITDLSIQILSPILSPDKKYLAFAADVFPECGIDDECNKKLNKFVEEGPIQAYMADDLLFRHWTEYRGLKETHIFIYDIQNKTYKDLAHSEWSSPMFKLGGEGRFCFSPDSKELCFTADPDSNLANSINTNLKIISIEGGEAVNITKENKAWDGNPVYSSDGLYIAFKVQKIPDYESDRYRIAIYNRVTKKTRVIAENFNNMINDIRWSPDSKSIYFTADIEGYTPIYEVDINSEKISSITGNQAIYGFDVSNDKNEIYYKASLVDKPGEIYKIDAINKTFEQITFFNKRFLEEVDVRPAEQMWIEGADGKKVQVFIVKPHDFSPNKKYPLILNVHGGPQNMWMDSFRGDWQVYPGSGYIVAFPNPHGSTGFGEEYTQEISGDWGGKVYEDLMKVTDELEKIPYVDKDRIGAMGWSFGGYMMNWFQAKTKRFKCLVSMMGIFDLESMWGTTEEIWFADWDLKGQPWNSDIYQKYSPSNYVKNFATPSLIITGKKDYRVPYTQSVQYFTTLQTLGIDSRLIIFKNDGHWPDYVKSMPLYYNAHLDWFHKYLNGEPSPYKLEEMLKNSSFEKISPNP